MAADPVRRLDGWKAIADYLVRDVRTAQRWRDERAMPVHRVPGRKGGAVCADSAELDTWLFHTTPVEKEPKSATEPVDHAAPIDLCLGNSAPFLVGRGLSRVRWLAAVAVAVLAITGFEVSVSRLGTTTPVAVPERFELNGTTLLARAQDNSLLWSYTLADEQGAQLALGTFATIDWRRTGVADAIVFVNVQESGLNRSSFVRNNVYCFSARGAMRWKYTPDAKLAFAHREFSGPWRFRSWRALTGPQPRLGVSFIHQTWWPSYVMAFGPEGPEPPMFVNAGHIESLARIEGKSGAYILAGGVNNEYQSAALAVLDERGPAARSPQSRGSPFACDNCPEGKPRKYFVFPRSDINITAHSSYSYTDLAISERTADGIDVSVRMMMEGGPRAIYRFSPEFVPESVAMSDRYWQIHRELSQAGNLDHRPEDCPARISGVIVRMWEPDTGWKNINVPPTFTARRPNDSQ